MAVRIIALVVTLLTIGLFGSTADASPRRTLGLIVTERYSADNGGNPQLAAVRPSDGAVKILTTGHSDRVPDLSLDGRWVVFERCEHGDGCDEVGKINVWIMRVDGSGAHPLTTCDGTRCLGAFDPAFSADGRQIAFSQDLLDSSGANVQGIFVMRADGTGQRRLTSRAENELPDGRPDFSPDGSQLVFLREVEGGARLMIINSDGTGAHELLPGRDAFDPEWSPDGKRIAMTLITHHDGSGDSVDVATVRPDGTHLRLLTHETAGQTFAFQPDFSPSGKSLVFSESGSNGCHINVIDVNGHHRRPVPTDDECYFNSSWETGPR